MDRRRWFHQGLENILNNNHRRKTF
jgi:hypothetical protein